MMRFTIANDDEGTLHCEFCARDYEWPFHVMIYWADTDGPGRKSDPDVPRAILCHYTGDPNLSNVGFDTCPAILQWRSTDWELWDGDKSVQRDRGRLNVVRGQLFFE